MKQKESTRLSDYQRIVSYLYEYHHGIKGSNVGFAKIEKRQNQLRVYFHVKTNDQALEYKIYFYHFHQYENLQNMINQNLHQLYL